jgi:hypothetical protein
MAGLGDRRLVGPGLELQLTIDGRAVPHDEVLAELQFLARASARETTTGDVGEGLEPASLYAVAEQLAARAATPSTRRRYAAISRSFGDWLREQLGRPPDRRGPRRRRGSPPTRASWKPRAAAAAGPPRPPRGGSICRWCARSPGSSAVTTSPPA